MCFCGEQTPYSNGCWSVGLNRTFAVNESNIFCLLNESHKEIEFLTAAPVGQSNLVSYVGRFSHVPANIQTLKIHKLRFQRLNFLKKTFKTLI